MSQSTSIVALRPIPETVAQRIQRLQAEINALGGEQIAAMRAQVVDVIDAAREVAANPSLTPGARQVAEKLVRDGEATVQTLDAIQVRAS